MEADGQVGTPAQRKKHLRPRNRVVCPFKGLVPACPGHYSGVAEEGWQPQVVREKGFPGKGGRGNLLEKQGLQGGSAQGKEVGRGPEAGGPERGEGSCSPGWAQEPHWCLSGK